LAPTGERFTLPRIIAAVLIVSGAGLMRLL
jgi:hypothetical protein